jgi:peptidoglycan/LPS O-acetylase OafA/YrhL
VSQPTPNRFPSLDGLRAISISFVIMSHLLSAPGFFKLPFPLNKPSYGAFGVRVFFVISGFLISSLLFAEIRKTTTVSLPKFYFRRSFRIFPAFYANIAVMMVLAWLGIETLRDGDVLHAATYTTNYHYDRAWTLGHTWSLAVEEQFYLLWPAILLVLGKRRGLWIAAAFVLAAPVIRVTTYLFHLSDIRGIGETFQTVGDSIAAGCVLAGYRDVLDRSQRYLALQKSPLFALVPLAALVASSFDVRPSIDYPIGETIMNVCIALTIDWCLRHHEGRIGRVLNSAPFAFVGTLSYSLYLWQQIFLDHASKAWFAVFPLNLVLVVGAALASYYIVERPFLRWRERLEPRLFKRSAAAVPATS